MSSLHEFGLVSCHTSLPRAIESAQSIRSQRCARISPADLEPLPAETSLNPFGTPRRGLAARYASVAKVCRNGRSSDSSCFILGVFVLITNLQIEDCSVSASLGTLIGFRYARPLTVREAGILERIALEISQSRDRGTVARIVLRHAKRNILDFQMMDELSASLDQLEARHDVPTILIEAAGEHFSAGVDIPSHTPDKVATMLEKFHGVIRRFLKTSKVTVAAVKGCCLGGGAELAMTCDMVITTEAAHWGFPEIRLGCYPPVAAAALASVVGQKRAAELILTGRSFDG